MQTKKATVEQRLDAVEGRLERLEELLVQMSGKLDQTLQSAASRPPTVEPEKADALKHWVTDYVSMRLSQLVPETCEHKTAERNGEGPFLGDSNVRCTEDVVHRVKRIPIPFVREMVVQRVVQHAQRDNVQLVDVAYFEKAATF